MDLKQIQSNADRAFIQFETEKAALYRDDQPIFAPDVHREKIEDITDPLTTAIDEANAALDAGIEAAKTELAVINYGDPAAILLDDELATANKRAAFVKEDCADLPAAELAGRLAAAAASNDRVTQWLHWRYGTRRAEELRDQLKGPGPRVNQARLAGEMEEITKQLAVLNTALFPNQERDRAGVTARIAAAQRLQSDLTKRLRIASGQDSRDRARLTQQVKNLL